MTPYLQADALWRGFMHDGLRVQTGGPAAAAAFIAADRTSFHLSDLAGSRALGGGAAVERIRLCLTLASRQMWMKKCRLQ